MIARIEPTGISVRKGKVQIRFCFYLESTDARYDEHHVQVPIIPEGGYPGEVEHIPCGDPRYESIMLDGSVVMLDLTQLEVVVPVNMSDYNMWFENLPKKWQNNPFHNHFVRVSPDATDNEIEQLMQDSLDEFYGIWSRDEDIVKVWKSKREDVGSISPENIRRCELRGLDIANRASEFK